MDIKKSQLAILKNAIPPLTEEEYRHCALTYQGILKKIEEGTATPNDMEELEQVSSLVVRSFLPFCVASIIDKFFKGVGYDLNEVLSECTGRLLKVMAGYEEYIQKDIDYKEKASFIGYAKVSIQDTIRNAIRRLMREESRYVSIEEFTAPEEETSPEEHFITKMELEELPSKSIRFGLLHSLMREGSPLNEEEKNLIQHWLIEEMPFEEIAEKFYGDRDKRVYLYRLWQKIKRKIRSYYTRF